MSTWPHRWGLCGSIDLNVVATLRAHGYAPDIPTPVESGGGIHGERLRFPPPPKATARRRRSASREGGPAPPRDCARGVLSEVEGRKPVRAPQLTAGCQLRELPGPHRVLAAS
jgi:hypothetical protein